MTFRQKKGPENAIQVRIDPALEKKTIPYRYPPMQSPFRSDAPGAVYGLLVHQRALPGHRADGLVDGPPPDEKGRRGGERRLGERAPRRALAGLVRERRDTLHRLAHRGERAGGDLAAGVRDAAALRRQHGHPRHGPPVRRRAAVPDGAGHGPLADPAPRRAAGRADVRPGLPGPAGLLPAAP